MVVGETDDPVLWQKVLAAITIGDESDTGDSPGVTGELPSIHDDDAGDPIGRLASELTVPGTAVRAALAPSEEPPFLHLDARAWEAFTRNFPKRGSGAVPAITLALTALALWFQCLDTDPPTIAQGKEVLDTINVKGSNLPRSLRNCDWLQHRGDNVSVNPAEVTQAVGVVRAFCLKRDARGE